MKGFRVLHLRRYREHPGRALLSLVGIAVGGMLLTALLGMVGSITGSVARLGELTGDADLLVAAATDGGIPDSVVEEASALEDVEAAVPLVQVGVVIAGERALLLGADARAAALGELPLDACSVTVGPGLVVGPGLARAAGIRAGDDVDVRGIGTTTKARVLSTIDCPKAAEVNAGWFAAAPLPVAQMVSGRPDRVDLVLVVVAEGAVVGDVRERLADIASDRATVTTPDLRLRQVEEQVAPFLQGTSVIVGLAVVVAGFLVFNTMSMAALERRRELATLRALGGGRRRLLAGFLAEAAVLGLVGSAVGAAAGVTVGRALVGSLPVVIASAIGVQPSFHLPPSAIPLALFVGTGATVLATVVPARAAVSTPPVDAMRPEGVIEVPGMPPVRPVLLFAGSALLVGGSIFTIVVSGSATAAGFAAITLGAVLATYGVSGPLARLTAALAAPFGAPGRLAAASLERSPRRVWATSMAVLIGVGATVTIGGVVANQEDAIVRQMAPLAAPDLWVATTAGSALPADVQMPADWAAELGAAPGVDRVVTGQAVYMSFGDHRGVLEGIDGPSSVPALALADPAARQAVIDGEGTVLSRGLAQALDLAEGDTLNLATPTGRQQVPVVGVVEMIDNLLGGIAMVRLDLLERWYGRPGANWFEIYLEPGADVAAVRAAAERLADGAPFPVHIDTGEQYHGDARAVAEQSLALFSLMTMIIVLAVGLAVLNTLLLSIVERRRELGIIRAVGTSRRQLQHMVLGEALAIAAVAAALGVALGALQHWVAVEAVEGLTGVPLDHRWVASPVVMAVMVAVLLPAAGAALPAWRAGNVPVLDAIGYE